jgi:beta-N-acetylhexosaminidase
MNNWAQQVFDSLSLEQRVGQLICYRASQWADDTIDMARQGLVGGVSPNYYRGMQDSRTAILDFMNALRDASAVPVMMVSSHACEVQRFGATPLPGEGASMMLGATRDTDLAFKVAYAASLESKAFGFDSVWTPCVDVNTNPGNPIIGTRAFSDRPQLVIDMARAVVRGMQDARLIPQAKHFPGHGDTGFDTHVQIGVVEHDRRRLDEVELAPYRALIEDGLRGIETAHIIYPALDDTPDLPATMSQRCIHDLLRDEMGFEGLIFSDSLTMKAIKDHFGVEDAAVRALAAGHDVLLQDYDEPPRPTFDALLKAVTDGVIDRARFEASVMRVLEHKQWCGLDQRGRLNEQMIAASFENAAHQTLCRRVFEAGVTVLEADALPLKRGVRACVIATCAQEEGKAATDFAQTIESGRDVLMRLCREQLGDLPAAVIDEDPTPDQVDDAVQAAEDAQVVIFATFPRIVSYKALSGKVGPGQVRLVERLIKQGKRIVLCVFGTPYVITGFPRVEGCLTTYGSTASAVEAGIRVVLGQAKPGGRLPIDLSEAYPFGHGLTIN